MCSDKKTPSINSLGGKTVNKNDGQTKIYDYYGIPRIKIFKVVNPLFALSYKVVDPISDRYPTVDNCDN